MRIAVAGPNGALGSAVVAAARAAGHEVVPLGRRDGIDLLTGAGLDTALTGVDAVIDASNTFTLSARAATRFFQTATANLMAAEQRAGVGHHVAMSIVGSDQINASYYAGKVAHERAVEAGPVPHTILRATQFHDFVGQMMGTSPGPVKAMPTMLICPIDTGEVASRLVDIAAGTPQGRARDLVGPEYATLADLARRQLRFERRKAAVLSLPLPGAYGRGVRSGVLRGGPDADRGTVTFDEWLQRRGR